MTNEELDRLIEEELEALLDEKKGKKRKAAKKKRRKKKKAKKRDACYHKVKSRYKVWPSAYASGALVKCRKVGAKNWGNKSKNESLNEEESPLHKVAMALDSAGGAAGFKDLEKNTGLSRKEIQDVIDNTEYIDVHKAGDVIELSGLDEGRGRGCKLRISEETLEEKKKKKACKPSKGKRFAKRVNGKCRSFGQKGQAKGGGDRIRPGTKKGDAYCARSAKIKKCKNPPCANDLSLKKWKCRGSKSMREEVNENKDS